MAITFIDGFDLYSSASDLNRRGWTVGTASIGSFQTGRFSGSRALRVGNGNTNPMLLSIASTDTITIGFALKVENVGAFGSGGEILWRFRNGTTNILIFGITQDGRLRVGRTDFSSTLVCGSAASLIASGAWNYIEVELTRHASAGEANVYLNGALVASASSANTGASSIDNIGVSGGFTNMDMDDLYITNTDTKLGEVKVETIRPSADTATKQWTRSVGSDNYANVDETNTDDDTTYNSSGTVGQKDLFDLADLAATPSSVKAVNLILTARKDNSDPREIRTNMKNGTTTTNGTTRTLSTSYSMFSQIHETNPDDAAAFDGTDINAMQLGYEVVT